MATFGLKYYAELSSRYMKTLWRVEIAQRGYSGESEEMTFSGSSPIKITWEKRGDDFYSPVKASEATINILCKENFHYRAFFGRMVTLCRLQFSGIWSQSRNLW